MGSSATASGDFPIYPGERPSVADAKAWRLGSFDVMPSDWKALTAGIPPHSLVHLIDCIVPPPLPVAAVGPPIITVAMSLTRDMAISDAIQKNAVIVATRDSGMAGIRNSFFDALRRSLRPNAPLLLAALESTHPLVGACLPHGMMVLRPGRLSSHDRHPRPHSRPRPTSTRTT